MKLIILSILSFLSLTCLAQQTYHISTGIQVMDQDSGRSRGISPEDGYSFQITGEGDWYYRLRIVGPDGEELGGNFISSRSNIDNSFILANVLNQYDDVIEAIGELEDCDHCGQQAEAITGADRVPDAPTGEACQYFRRFREQGVPEEPLKQALLFYSQNRDRFENDRYISIADYTQNSRNERFYILDMQTGQVRSEKVSHGSGNRNGVKVGDPNHDGMIDRCHHGSDINDRTNMTRAGFFETRNFYSSASHKDIRNGVLEWPNLDRNGNNGLRMEGLSPGVNDEAMSSGVVMHGAWYNDVSATMGRSYGCPAFESDVAPSVLNTIRGGSLYYSYTPRCERLHSMVENQVRGWEGMCE
jgi:hypothetical protein